MLRKWVTAALLAAVAALPLDGTDVALTGAADAAPPATVASAWTGEAPCLAPDRLSVRVVAARIARQMQNAPRLSASVAGFRLEDEAEPLVEALRRLAPGAEPPAEKADASCHKALCASQALFGAEVGPRLLYLLVRYGYDGAPMKDVTQPWTAEQLDEVLAALGDLPASLLPLDGSVRTVAHDHALNMLQTDERDPLGDTPIAASGGALDGIRIGAGWHAAEPPERRASIVHEIAHQFAASRQGRTDWPILWARAMAADAAWARRIGQPTSEVSLYAGRNAEEDFAESATAYRYMPDLLGMRAPNRYAMLKEWMFDGLEYHAADQCQPVIANSQLARIAAATAPISSRRP